MGCSRLVTSQDLMQMQTSSGIDETDTSNEEQCKYEHRLGLVSRLLRAMG